MRTEKAKVRSKKETVGFAEYKQYDTDEEMLADLGEGKARELVNSQVKTNAMNAIRGNAAGTPTKQQMRYEATSLIAPERWSTELAGDPAAIEAAIEEKMVEVEAKYKDKQAQAKAAAQALDTLEDSEDSGGEEED